jgi:hypothetical protein
MRRIPTTVVALVGEASRPVLAGLDRAANVRALLADPEEPPLERAAAAWRAASGTHRAYLVHDADPLAAVADAWVGTFDQRAPAGTLEVAVAETLRRWRAGALELPDYYLALDVDAWPPTPRHWYLGVLHRAAPARVVPAAGTATAVRERLGHLAPGRWWPALDRLLEGIDRAVPDRL